MLRKIKEIMKSNGGFTIIELLIASSIFIIAFVGVLLSFVKCMEFNEMSKNATNAMLAVKSRVEEIENTDFTQVFATYDHATFTSPGLNGIGVSYVNIVSTNMLELIVSFSWKEKNGRIIGEDTNLNGQINGFEDSGGVANVLDSPVMITKYIYN